MRSRTVLAAVLAGIPLLYAQTPPPADSQPERWNVYFQATSIGQSHGSFASPYEGPNSLSAYPERDVSLTSTIFLGLRLWHGAQFYIDPEVAGGRGFSGVTGMANFPNGEMPRVSSATPTPYLARAYLVQDFSFSGQTEAFDSSQNQLAGKRPAVRYTVIVGRFSVEDFFDQNRYAHDPRTQFMGWAVMANGAWDYPADVRGYTWGWVHEFHHRNWSVRYASAAEPKVANGPRLDRRVFRDRGDVVEGERDWHSGAVRVLAYRNHADAGDYREALRLSEATGSPPDVVATRRPGTIKYGTGLSFDQEAAPGVGVFARLGWNDGRTETFAFTAIDHVASGGVSISGKRWNRPDDTAASAVTVSGLSAVHAEYLARGGLDFNIGDGRLNYGRETVWESYYSARMFPGFFFTLDAQRVINPAYNRDRGPLWVFAARLHAIVGR